MKFSIVIPTYNRGNLALKRVRELLPYLTDEIDLWVLNNHSTLYVDEYNEIGAIDDKNLHYIVNETNIGGNPNFKKGYKVCDGDFVLFSSDEDSVVGSSLSPVVGILKEHPDVSFWKGKSVNYDWDKTKIASPGMEALDMIFQNNNYLSGSIYNKHILTPEILEIYDQAYAGNIAYQWYSHMFWSDFCALNGFCVQSPIQVIIEHEGNADEEAARENSEKDDIYVMGLPYTSYKQRIAQFNGFLGEIADWGCEMKIKVAMTEKLIAKYLFLIRNLYGEYNKRNLDFLALFDQAKEEMVRLMTESEVGYPKEDLTNLSNYARMITVNSFIF